MLKPFHYGMLLLGIVVSSNVLAACKAKDRVKADTTPTLFDRLYGTTVCGTEDGGATFQEEHRRVALAFDFFQLWDYKKGPGDPVDPSSPIGKWKIVNNGNKVRYKYGPSVFNYTVHEPSPGTLEYCTGNNGTLVVTATIINDIKVGCGF